MRIIRWLGILAAILVVAIGILLIAARFADGPLGMIAGGPLVAGQLVTEEPDWTFARDVPTVELQLLTPPRSRTTWILEEGGAVYIPSNYMNSTVGRYWKHWPLEAEQDGRAMLRIGAKRYPCELVRITSGPLIAPLAAEMSRKYGVSVTPAMVESGDLWLFELKPRSVGEAP
jgi:hypothetical protein